MPTKSRIVEIVRRNIRARIEASGLSRAAVSRASGLSESAIRDILKGGDKGPTISSLQAIADELGCSLSDLVTEAPTAQPPHGDPMLSLQQHEPGTLRLHLNQVVTVSQFMRIMAILNEAGRSEAGTESQEQGPASAKPG